MGHKSARAHRYHSTPERSPHHSEFFPARGPDIGIPNTAFIALQFLATGEKLRTDLTRTYLLSHKQAKRAIDRLYDYGAVELGPSTTEHIYYYVLTDLGRQLLRVCKLIHSHRANLSKWID